MKYIFYAFNALMGLVMMFALCCLDSESMIPFMVFLGSGLYLCVAGYFYERRMVEDEE